MDEFEKIRAFSEQMSQRTEESLKLETAESQEESMTRLGQTEQGNPDFLREWNREPIETNTTSNSLHKTFIRVSILASVTLIALLCVIYLLLKTPMQTQEEIPVISPTPLPVKVKPENPGGMIIPDQDKVIYDRISQDTTPIKVERLFPEEIPVLPTVADAVEVEEVNDDKTATEILVPVVIAEPEEKKIEEKKHQPVEELKEKVVKEVKATEVQKPTKKKEVLWHAQLFSSTDKNKVEKTWKTILAKHKGLLSDIPMNIVKAEISGKGTFYRLQVGDFSSKEKASTLCAKLKKQNQDCIPAKE